MEDDVSPYLRERESVDGALSFSSISFTDIYRVGLHE